MRKCHGVQILMQGKAECFRVHSSVDATYGIPLPVTLQGFIADLNISVLIGNVSIIIKPLNHQKVLPGQELTYFFLSIISNAGSELVVGQGSSYWTTAIRP